MPDIGYGFHFGFSLQGATPVNSPLLVDHGKRLVSSELLQELPEAADQRAEVNAMNELIAETGSLWLAM
ncbi:hypothetical protein [Streptomyces sp. NPDC059761]|uniref:hypothetical protein n=1 Tax=Streptomyces sp. NPDC059761 TaxID=3346937 RepID=UPI0036577980